MTEAIIVAIIAALGALLGSIIPTLINSSRTQLRLDNIEKKMDIHNGYAERFAEIQTDIAVIKALMDGGK